MSAITKPITKFFGGLFTPDAPSAPAPQQQSAPPPAPVAPPPPPVINEPDKAAAAAEGQRKRAVLTDAGRESTTFAGETGETGSKFKKLLGY